MTVQRAQIQSRLLNIIIKPIAEWQVIKREKNEINNLISTFVLPIVGIVAAVALIFGTVNVDLLNGFGMFVSIFITNLLSVVIASYILLELPKSFGGETNLGTASAIVIYASVPSWIVTVVVSVNPVLVHLHWLSLYSYIIFYFGLSALIEIPADKRVGFNIIAALILLLVNSLIGEAGKRILYAII